MPDRLTFTGPVSDREQVRWQLRATRQLADLLERAHREGLPPVDWLVAAAGCGLAARCLTHDPARRRADFEAWAGALGGTASTMYASAGATYLRATSEQQRPDGRVRLTVLATIHPTDRDAAGEPHEMLTLRVPCGCTEGRAQLVTDPTDPTT